MNRKSNSLSSNPSQLAVVAIILIVVGSYGTFFYLQSINENSIKSALYERYREDQKESTRAIANHMKSDLDSIAARVKLIAYSEQLQKSSNFEPIHDIQQLIKETFVDISNTGIVIDGIRIVDSSNRVSLEYYPEYAILNKSFVGRDLSSAGYIQEAQSIHAPSFSRVYEGLNGQYRISITHPIINRQTGDYYGLVSVAIPSVDFIQRYGNLYDLNSQYFQAFDKDANYIASGFPGFIGKNFYGEYVQKAIDHNPNVRELVSTVLSGTPYDNLSTINLGERLGTGYPIIIDGEVKYAIFQVTPTAAIYAQIDSILFNQKVETFSLLVGVSAAVIVLIVLLIRWNSTLNKAVQERTAALNQSNNQLARVNEQLVGLNEKMEKTNEKLLNQDKMQREFINVAAHELRTPVQPLLGITELIKERIDGKDKGEITKDDIELLERNAKRLERLSSDILEVSRIESNSLKLNKEVVNLNEKVKNVISDFKSFMRNGERVQIIFQPKADKPILVEADRIRLFEVISNLLRNAIKFTHDGIILITLEQKEGQAIVSIKDTGTGIDPAILPRLFEKFATRSDQGTGLGLYISKAIIEAHNGKIWAENNPGGNGATFTFMLPMM